MEGIVVDCIKIKSFYGFFISSIPNIKTIKKVDKMILEYKSKNLNQIDIFDGTIPFQFSRISKYCDGFNELFNLPHLQREIRY